MEGRKAIVRYISSVSDKRAADPEPQTMDVSPKHEVVGPSVDFSVRVSHGMEGHSLLTHLLAFLAWALS